MPGLRPVPAAGIFPAEPRARGAGKDRAETGGPAGAGPRPERMAGSCPREIGTGGGRMADYKESDPFYHSKEWKRIRMDALMRDGGMCQDCMEKFRAGIIRKPRRATMVHHIIPRKERPDLELVMDNLRSLCAKCHEEHHPERREKAKRKTEARRGAHSMRVIKV